MYQSNLTTTTSPSSTKMPVTSAGKPLPHKQTGTTTHISPQRLKLPLGAIVSPLSPFFNERAKNFVVQQAKASYMEEALQKLNNSTESHQNRFRSRSTSSESKQSEGGSSAYSYGDSSSTSNESSDSNHSFATAITLMEDEQLPQNLPRISHEEWSKFGISLFTPKLSNPHSQMYYHYPSVEKTKNNGPSNSHGNRPRSKSSLTPRASALRYCDEADREAKSDRHFAPQSAGATPSSPLAYHQSFERNPSRFTLERNHTRS